MEASSSITSMHSGKQVMMIVLDIRRSDLDKRPMILPSRPSVLETFTIRQSRGKEPCEFGRNDALITSYITQYSCREARKQDLYNSRSIKENCYKIELERNQ